MFIGGIGLGGINWPFPVNTRSQGCCKLALLMAPTIEDTWTSKGPGWGLVLAGPACQHSVLPMAEPGEPGEPGQAEPWGPGMKSSTSNPARLMTRPGYHGWWIKMDQDGSYPRKYPHLAWLQMCEIHRAWLGSSWLALLKGFHHFPSLFQVNLKAIKVQWGSSTNPWRKNHQPMKAACRRPHFARPRSVCEKCQRTRG